MADDDPRETWYLPSPDGEGSLVFHAHPAGSCAGRGCALHAPSDHWARDMPLRWEYASGSGGRMLRVCPHGAEHDDPDDWAYRRGRGQRPGRFEPCACGCPCECDFEDVPF